MRAQLLKQRGKNDPYASFGCQAQETSAIPDAHRSLLRLEDGRSL